MENKETEKEEKIKKLYNEFEKLEKESANTQKEIDDFGNISFKATKDVLIEEMEVRKFITEQELKNIDVILNILKLITSLSISIFIASLTTVYFNEKVYIIIFINLLSAGSLAIFIDARKNILEKNKKILLKIFKKSAITTYNNMLTKSENIQSKLNDNKKKVKEEKRIIKNLQK